MQNTVTDLMNALPGNSCVNMVQHATIDEAVFFVDSTEAPIDRLDSDHVTSARSLCFSDRSECSVCVEPGLRLKMFEMISQMAVG
jgi:hypothetical protein